MELLLSGITLGVFFVLFLFGLYKLVERIREFKWTVVASSNSISQLFTEVRMLRESFHGQDQRVRNVDNLNTEMLNATARLARRYNEIEVEVKALQSRVAALEHKALPSGKRATKCGDC